VNNALLFNFTLVFLDNLSWNHYIVAMRLPIAIEGLPIIKWVWFAFLMSFFTLDGGVIGGFGVVLVFVVSFFRDPLRKKEYSENTIISAADGVITQVNDVQIEGQNYTQIVAFLSVFNCHVNRIPFSGTIIKTTHIPGKFLAAMRGDIDKKNERQETDIDTAIGLVRVVQITGAIARRICCGLVPDQVVKTGARFGLIRFGSRTDVYLPTDKVTVLVKKGDKVKGALTPIATVNPEK
jgi:phosphatidylserine decarboxylase